eukprot:scaffold22930_cov23-Tisochrysis_lutea.AAC.1
MPPDSTNQVTIEDKTLTITLAHSVTGAAYCQKRTRPMVASLLPLVRKHHDSSSPYVSFSSVNIGSALTGYMFFLLCSFRMVPPYLFEPSTPDQAMAWPDGTPAALMLSWPLFVPLALINHLLHPHIR